jgi:hypothetical protein
MDRTRLTNRMFKLAKPWLAGVLALLWLVVAAEAAGHHCDSHHQAGKECAACQMAHGTVLANGSTGTAIELPVVEVSYQSVWVFAASDTSDLRLSPGRAPPA